MSISERPTVVCAWCERTLFRGTPAVSHGICRACLQTYMPDVYSDLARERGWE